MLPLMLMWACEGSVVDTAAMAEAGVVFLDERSPPNFRLARWQDAETAETVFAVPSGGWLYELDIHDSHGGVAMAYTEPAADGEEGYDRSGIFLVGDDGEAERVACEDAAGVWCFYPQWSADGERLWFVRYDERHSDPIPVLAWVSPETGEGADAQEWATEPAVSPSGAVSWVGVDPDSGVRSLELGDAEGAWQQTLVAPGAVEDLGQPMFSADGDEVWFVVLEAEEEEPAGDWPGLQLISTASAHDSHDLPGDWWAAPTDGSALRRLTWLSMIHYDGAVDPSSGALLSATELGLVRVAPDTGETDWLWSARTLRAVDTALTISP